jgi:hypothetical protein
MYKNGQAQIEISAGNSETKRPVFSPVSAVIPYAIVEDQFRKSSVD